MDIRIYINGTSAYPEDGLKKLEKAVGKEFCDESIVVLKDDFVVGVSGIPSNVGLGINYLKSFLREKIEEIFGKSPVIFIDRQDCQ